MSAIQSIAIFIIGMTLATTFLIVVGEVLNLPVDLPVEVGSTIKWLLSNALFLDFILPVKLLFQLFSWIIGIELTLLFADGIIFVWKNLKRMS